MDEITFCFTFAQLGIIATGVTSFMSGLVWYLWSRIVKYQDLLLEYNKEAITQSARTQESLDNLIAAQKGKAPYDEVFLEFIRTNMAER